MRFAQLRKLLRHPRLVRWYPARFRTTAHQHVMRELRVWVADQFEAEGRSFDARYGVHTSWFDLGNYEPTPPSVIEAALEALPVDLERFAFVDLGSGKGRAVLLAALRPFARVVGIEHRWLLHRRAERNLERFASCTTLRTGVELIHGDVLESPLPPEPVALFFFNPFPPETLDAFLCRVDGEAAAIAVHPTGHEVLLRHGFERTEEHRAEVEDRCFSVYVRSAQVRAVAASSGKPLRSA